MEAVVHCSQEQTGKGKTAMAGGKHSKSIRSLASSSAAATSSLSGDGDGSGGVIGADGLTTTTKRQKEKKSKSKKKGTKNKQSKSGKNNNRRNDTFTLPHDDKTTSEGLYMSQVLSTFNSEEMSRFEAFRRCTFRSDVLQDYIADCLIEAHEKRVLHYQQKKLCFFPAEQQNQNQIGKDKDKDRKRKRKIELKDLVARSSTANDQTNPAQEIAIVVSTLAKAYAQRLVMQAKIHQEEEIALKRLNANTNNNGNEKEKALSVSNELMPHHILQAHEFRVRRNLDPGFFLHAPKLHPNQCSSSNIYTNENNNVVNSFSFRGNVENESNISTDYDTNFYRSKVEAALLAQEAFDEFYKNHQNNQENDDEPQETKEKQNIDVDEEEHKDKKIKKEDGENNQIVKDKVMENATDIKETVDGTENTESSTYRSGQNQDSKKVDGVVLEQKQNVDEVAEVEDIDLMLL